MFLIVIYIALQVRASSSRCPVILAMLHDIVITVGVYSIAFKEVSVATVAAVLTVLGYSIYDTIIIFDRVRENVPLMRKQPFATIVNVSLWETIRRSLATTFITLLPIIALEILGGATLEGLRLRAHRRRRSPVRTRRSSSPRRCSRSGRSASRSSRSGSSFAGRRRRAERWRSAAAAARRLRPQGDPDVALEESEQALAAEPTPELARRHRRRRPSRARRRAARSAVSAAARDRMAARGSGRIVDALGELLAELPERRARQPGEALGAGASAR